MQCFESEMKECAKKKKDSEKYKKYEKIQELIDNGGSSIADSKMKQEMNEPEFLKKYVKISTKSVKAED